MRKYLKKRQEKYYKNSRFHLVADITFLSIIILLMATFFIIRHWQPQQPIEFSLKALDSQITSGSAATFELSYSSHKSMTKNVLAIEFPDNFMLTSVEPAESFNKEANTIYLPDLEKGANGKIKISGIVLGEIGSEQALALTFNCQECGPGVLTSVFYKIEASALSLNLNLPEYVYQGVEFKAHASLRNDGARDLENIKLRLNDNWELSGQKEIVVDKIASGETKEIDFAAITRVSKDKENFVMSAFLNIAQIDLKQLDLSREVGIKIPNFKFIITSDKNTIASNDSVIYEINYQNRETTPLSNIKLSIGTDNNNFKINKITLIEAGKNVQLTNNVLTLAGELEPEASGRIKVKVDYSRLKAEVNQEVALILGLDYGINSQTLHYEVSAPAVKTLTSLKVRSGAYYYSSQGDQLGVGPLPPVVDMATNYWVFWEITNLGNDLDNVQISADLSPDVVWIDNKTLLAGELQHGEIGGRVIWTVETIPSNTGDDRYRAGFEIGIIPTTDQVGKVLELVKNIRYSAHDKFGDQVISGSLKNLNTNLEADILGSGKGEVLLSE
jgi:hypothetical protein